MHRYGGFWLRFIAYLIDAILLQVAEGIVGAVFGFGASAVMLRTSHADVSSMPTLEGGLIAFVIAWLYCALLESSPMQATLGKKVLGMVVTNDIGNRIGFGQATGRHFAKILSALIIGFGFFMIGWTERKRGLHDMIASTLVYKARDPRTVSANAAVFE